MKVCIFFMHVRGCVCVCDVNVVRIAKDRPGKISHLQAWDCC